MRFEGRGQAGCALRCRDPIVFGQTGHKMWSKRLWSTFGQTDLKTFDWHSGCCCEWTSGYKMMYHQFRLNFWSEFRLQDRKMYRQIRWKSRSKIVLPTAAVSHCFTIWPPTVWHSSSSDLSDMKLHCLSEFWYEVWWQKPLSPTFRFTVMVIWNISLGAFMIKATYIFYYNNLCTNNVCFQKCLLMLPPYNLTLNWSVGLI